MLLISGLHPAGVGVLGRRVMERLRLVLVAWVAAGALVHGIGEIALAFQIHQGRRGIIAVEQLADFLSVPTNNHPALDTAVPTR